MPETPAGSAGAGPPVVPEDTLPAGALPEEYLRRAKEAYEAGRIPSGLAILDLFRERFPSGSDEAWWLYGRMLEAPSPSRDIRGALEYYRRIIREYPQSPRYAEARRRIAYLERYYFNIQ
jgi:outer membrane protein assembly factor BamD (BamD/ComL family)